MCDHRNRCHTVKTQLLSRFLKLKKNLSKFICTWAHMLVYNLGTPEIIRKKY